MCEQYDNSKMSDFTTIILYNTFSSFPLKNFSWVFLTYMPPSNFYLYLQFSISSATAGICLMADLYWDRQLMGTVAAWGVFIQSHFLYSCDIWTTSEVSQLFQWINHGSRSSYLTFTLLAQHFVVLFFYLLGSLEEISNGLVHVHWHCSLPLPPPTLSTSPRKLWISSYSLPLCQSKYNQHSARGQMVYRFIFWH